MTSGTPNPFGGQSPFQPPTPSGPPQPAGPQNTPQPTPANSGGPFGGASPFGGANTTHNTAQSNAAPAAPKPAFWKNIFARHPQPLSGMSVLLCVIIAWVPIFFVKYVLHLIGPLQLPSAQLVGRDYIKGLLVGPYVPIWGITAAILLLLFMVGLLTTTYLSALGQLYERLLCLLVAIVVGVALLDKVALFKTGDSTTSYIPGVIILLLIMVGCWFLARADKQQKPIFVVLFWILGSVVLLGAVYLTVDAVITTH